MARSGAGGDRWQAKSAAAADFLASGQLRKCLESLRFLRVSQGGNKNAPPVRFYML
jgi:hypothetical protein